MYGLGQVIRVFIVIAYSISKAYKILNRVTLIITDNAIGLTALSVIKKDMNRVFPYCPLRLKPRFLFVLVVLRSFHSARLFPVLQIVSWFR